MSNETERTLVSKSELIENASRKLLMNCLLNIPSFMLKSIYCKMVIILCITYTTVKSCLDKRVLTPSHTQNVSFGAKIKGLSNYPSLSLLFQEIVCEI